MARLITYGCSFTNYNWSTWADILAENSKLHLINRGQGGCGNNFIFARLQQDMATGMFQKDDVIRIMWCYYNRVSRFDTADTLLDSPPETTVQSDKIKNFKKTIDMIKHTQDLLQGYDYEFMTWLHLKDCGGLETKRPQKIQDYNIDSIWHKPIHPPLIDLVFNGNFSNRTDFAVKFSDLPKSIVKNIQKLSEKSNSTVLSLIREQSKPGDNRYQMFFDYHPTPLMHLEYLQKIYPDMAWSKDLTHKINQENQRILSSIH